jgi:hypothetical protein
MERTIYLRSDMGHELDSERHADIVSRLDIVEGNSYGIRFPDDGNVMPMERGDWTALVTYRGPNAPARLEVLPVGTRVRRGPDWNPIGCYYPEDARIGTVVMFETRPNGFAGVKFDGEAGTWYVRWGYDDCSALEVLALPEPAKIEAEPTTEQLAAKMREVFDASDARRVSLDPFIAAFKAAGAADCVTRSLRLGCDYTAGHTEVWFEMSGERWTERRQHIAASQKSEPAATRNAEPLTPHIRAERDILAPGWQTRAPTGYDGDDRPEETHSWDAQTHDDIVGADIAFGADRIGSLDCRVSDFYDYTPAAVLARRKAEPVKVRVDNGWHDPD